MLVLSRRETETIEFPAIGTTVQLVRIQGKVARIGIKAPRDLKILRGELSESSMEWYPEGEGDLFTQTHDMKNKLNVATVGLTLMQRYLDCGQITEAKSALRQIIDKFVDGEADNNRLEATPQSPLALLVEDDANERSLMAGLLKTSGIDVEVAGDGAEALGHLKAGVRPDVVLMDMLMPECDGPTAVRAIRKNPLHQGLRIFAISGTDPRQFGLETGPQGIDRWFSKPVDPESLVDQLAKEVLPAV